MSIKTSKRIALGVIASLVFAPFAAIAPASANAVTLTTSLPTVGTAVQTASVGSTVSSTVGFTMSAALAVGDVATFTATSVTITAPAASTVTLADNNGAIAGTTAAFSQTGGTTGMNAAVATNNGAVTTAAATAAVAVAATAGTVSITPDVPGEYTITVTTGGPATRVAKIYAYAQAPNGATVVGFLGDGGYPTNNSILNGVAGPANTVEVRVFPSASTTATPRTLVVVEGAGASILSSSGAASVPANGSFAVGATSATIAHQSIASTHTNFVIATPTVGTATVRIFRETGTATGIYSGTAAGTLTINVAATGSAGVISVANSSVFGNTGTLTDAATSTTDENMVSVAGTGTSAVRARFTVDVYDVLNNRMPSSTTALSVSVAGPGLLSSSNAVGTARVLVLSWSGSGVSDFYLSSDGTAGTSTVTVSWGSTVLATKTVTFTGAARTLTAGLLKPHITAAATTDAFWVLAVDANSNAVSFASPTSSSSNTTVLANNVTNCVVADSAQRELGAPRGSFVCDVTGVGVGTATLTISPASTTTNSPTLNFRVTKQVITSLELKTNKASYLPGEKITLSLEAKDADGNLIGARTAGYDVLSAFSVNQALTGTAFDPAAALQFNAGVVETTYFAPLVTGSITFEATLDGTAAVATALQGTKISRTIAIAVPVPPVVVPEPVYEKPTLSIVESGGRIFLSGTAEEGEGDIIIYVKRVGTTAWKERARTFEVAAPGDFNGSIKAPRGNVVIRVKQEGTGLFSNQVIIVK